MMVNGGFKYNATQVCMYPFVVLMPVNTNEREKRENEVEMRDDMWPVATRCASHVMPKKYSTLLQVALVWQEVSRKAVK